MKLHAHDYHSMNSLPLITSQTFFQRDLQMLAVIFDIKNSPNTEFYPHFSQNSTFDIVTLQQDFLWESHCYELFLAFSNTVDSPYLEINFSPKGEFNLYHFDSYRTPSQMPPRRLDLAESQRQQLLNFYCTHNELPAIFWQNSLANQQTMQSLAEQKFPLETGWYRLGMLINLSVLVEIFKVEILQKIWLNPCAVYKEKQKMAYFAYRHPSPPDFHDKEFWLTLKI